MALVALGDGEHCGIKRKTLHKNDQNARGEIGTGTRFTDDDINAHQRNIQHGGHLLCRNVRRVGARGNRHTVYFASHDTSNCIYVGARLRHVCRQGASQPRHGQGNNVCFNCIFPRRRIRHSTFRIRSDIFATVHAPTRLYRNHTPLRNGLRHVGVYQLPLPHLQSCTKQQPALRRQSVLLHDRACFRRSTQYTVRLHICCSGQVWQRRFHK